MQDLDHVIGEIADEADRPLNFRELKARELESDISSYLARQDEFAQYLDRVKEQ